MQGEIEAVRKAAAECSLAGKALVEAADALATAVDKAKKEIVGIEGKVDRLRKLEVQLKETEDAVALKQTTLGQVTEQLAAIKAQIPG